MSKIRPTRYYSKKQENAIAKSINGNRVANSGATAFNKGDVITNDFLIECKTTVATLKNSFSIKREWLEKNEEEAFAMNKAHSALAFNFGEGESNYYIISEKHFKEYINLLQEESKNEDDRL